MDLSPLRKFEILGPDAESLMQATITRDARKLSVGQVVYTALCNDDGGLIDESTVFRLGQDNFRYVAGHDYVGIWLKEQAERLGLEKVQVKSSTDQLHNVAIQGPNSRDILRRFVWTPATQPTLDELGLVPLPDRAHRGSAGHPHRRVAHRLHRRARLRDLLPPHRRAGCVGRRAGSRARTGGSPLSGSMRWTSSGSRRASSRPGTNTTTRSTRSRPASASRSICRNEEDFVGRAALQDRSAHPQRGLVGLELEGNEVAGHGDSVYVGRQQVGVVTSGTRSPILKKNIALARVSMRYGELGSRVEVGKLDGQQKRIGATVVRFPFYDPEKTRPRS